MEIRSQGNDIIGISFMHGRRIPSEADFDWKSSRFEYTDMKKPTKNTNKVKRDKDNQPQKPDCDTLWQISV